MARVAVLYGLISLIVPVALAQQPSAPARDTQSPFLSIPPVSSDSLRFGAQLAQFEAKDITERTWRLEYLRGKLTLIYIWDSFMARATDAHDPHARESTPGLPDLPEL